MKAHVFIAQHSFMFIEKNGGVTGGCEDDGMYRMRHLEHHMMTPSEHMKYSAISSLLCIYLLLI